MDRQSQLRLYTTINHRRPTSCMAFLGCACAFLILSLSGAGFVQAASHQDAADFLYQLGQEHQHAGRFVEAARDYREVLILNPSHKKAREALSKIEAGGQARREQVMDEALNRIVQRQSVQAVRPEAPAAGAAKEAVAPITVDVEPTEPAHPFTLRPSAAGGRVLRVPDPRINGIEWLYVFGKQGKADYGALPDAQRVYIDVPAASPEPVSVRVIDADVRGRVDEIDGEPNTSTTFRLLSADKPLQSQSVTPQTPDHTNLLFGPVSPDAGEAVGDQRRFCLEAEGGDGNDNNLFALEVKPSDARCFSLQPSIRLASGWGSKMEFYPEIPAGASQVLEERNYDLDPDGGQAALIPVTRQGKTLRPVALARSDSGVWSTTRVPVPEGADATRWKYRITKGTQDRGNMSFRVNDSQGRPLPIFFAPGGAPAPARTPAAAAAPQRFAEAEGACNTFTFDGSASYDPDRQPLTYLWDFGDGTTAEGVRVEHTYAQGGNYRVRLRVKDPTTTTCCESEVEHLLAVNLPPRAVIEAPERVCAGSSVHLSAAKSSGTAGETLHYHWDFSDGSTAEGAEADHVFASGRVQRVVLTLDDGRQTPCSQAQATATIRVNSAPIVKTSDVVQVCSTQPTGPLEAQFSAAGSRDPDGDPLNFSWDFGDGSRGSGERVTHTYLQGGHYTALLTVDDGGGSACSTVTAAVPVYLNHAPIAYADPPSTGCPDTLITFNGTRSSDADGQPLTYMWDFGDGHSEEGATVQHAYATSGPHRARLTVKDNSSTRCNASAVEIPVSINAPPVASMSIRGGRGIAITTSSEELPRAPKQPIR